MSQVDPRVKAIFEKYDGNGDQVIERSEFVSFFKDMLKELGSTDEQANAIFDDAVKRFDDNNNQALELEEFSKLIDELVQHNKLVLK
jgi:Ca2+-binding EF-hand superfamily protein